jgi:putative oxidoreductase
MTHLVLVGRLIFGAWMLANGANHFFFSLWPIPTGHEPLAVQLMAALVHSHLFDVAMAIQLVAGALILSGFLVPVALCVVMPVLTCAIYWSVILDHQPLSAVLALVAFAINGLLMLAYIDYYKGVLRRRALTLGEA